VKFDVQAIVRLKMELLDPQGKAIEGALPALGWSNVEKVRVGKVIDFIVDAENEAAAIDQGRDMCERFLSNPVIEVASVSVIELPGNGEGFVAVPVVMERPERLKS
jgi:phosphoribosylformylglycinamidine synthase subunit PurS